MRMSKLLAPTLRDNPAEAEVVSHQLLVRAGYIRRLANGVYNYLPLMWRVLRKVEQIVREEMDRSGAQELLMPILQPAEVWQASGRWDVYGELMVRVQDRHGRWYGLAPTAEEVITDIATKEVHSYRQLPINLYQIQTKYRDEIRPRFGLLRGREFIMKDAYSFHASQACMDKEYDNMAQAYTRIFDRCGLETRMVRSDSGAIGGSVSHEYMVLTRIAEGEQESGENDVFFCDACDYAANAERAESILPTLNTTGNYPTAIDIDTPNASSIEDLQLKHGIQPETIVKALVYMLDEKTPIMALIRGDLAVEEVKLLNVFGGNEIRLATDDEINRYFGAVKGFIGPYRFGDSAQDVKLIADHSVSGLQNFVIAINQAGQHRVGVNWQDELVQRPEMEADIRLARIGDTCVECQKGSLQLTRGIEVGNIFQLGTKYSSAMNATYTDEDGMEKPFIMGCYGIGVSRTAAAAIERFHDKFGIIWPMAIAPYQVAVVPVNVQEPAQINLALQIYEALQFAGIEVVLDDRDERAGVKFKDADLIGFPIRVTAGKKSAEGLLEVKLRDQSTAQDMPVADVLPFVQDQILQWKPFASVSSPVTV